MYYHPLALFKPWIDYLALGIATLPASAILTVLVCCGIPRVKRWLDRLFTTQHGNRYRDESWHSKHPGEILHKRTRR